LIFLSVRAPSSDSQATKAAREGARFDDQSTQASRQWQFTRIPGTPDSRRVRGSNIIARFDEFSSRFPGNTVKTLRRRFL